MEIFEILARKGTRKILSALNDGKSMRFSDLKKLIGYSTTASRTLKAMEQMKLIEREVINEPYRPVVYTLTGKGHKLASILEELEKLGA